MKTKIVGRFLLFCLFGTLFTGCTEEEDFNSDAPAIELHVSSGLVAASRTTLPGPHPVYRYIYSIMKIRQILWVRNASILCLLMR